MLLYRTAQGPLVQHAHHVYRVPEHSWLDLVNNDQLPDYLSQLVANESPCDNLADELARPLIPMDHEQEIWAAGVTYYRSRTARMEESHEAGGGSFYDRVYNAARPELFFKATYYRSVGPGDSMHLRSDSKWIVPEPELTLVVTRTGTIVGYTIGNDLSCRDIEGENPLYLPQAKTFRRCASVGPAIYVTNAPLPPDTQIRLTIRRNNLPIVEDSTRLDQMKRSPAELVNYLFRENAHRHGCLLMTGTGIIPADDFCLQDNDIVEIEIDNIGTLRNTMTP
ncbi:MAG: fumarylacetoacetate hydrolase family protein [Pirellulaceae bacterium]